MRTLLRAIRRSTLIVAILAVLATGAVFVPTHHASAAGSPYISIQNTGSGYAVVGQGFTPGATVYLGKYQYLNGQWQLDGSDTVTASQCYMSFWPYAHCANTPGTFTYPLPGNMGAYVCDQAGVFAYDYTLGWSNEADLYTSNSGACIG
jgi:hypothetical protein